MHQGGIRGSNPHIQAFRYELELWLYHWDSERLFDLPKITKLLNGTTRIQFGTFLSAELFCNSGLPLSHSGLLMKSEVFFLPRNPCLRLHLIFWLSSVWRTSVLDSLKSAFLSFETSFQYSLCRNPHLPPSEWFVVGLVSFPPPSSRGTYTR